MGAGWVQKIGLACLTVQVSDRKGSIVCRRVCLCIPDAFVETHTLTSPHPPPTPNLFSAFHFLSPPPILCLATVVIVTPFCPDVSLSL